MKQKILKLLLIALLSTTLVACVPSDKKVVVTSYPVEFLVRTLAGERVQVERLYEGSVPQTAVIRSDYEKVLKDADAIFYINELQPYWEVYEKEINNEANNLEFIDLAERSVLYDFARYTTIRVDDEQHVVESSYYSPEAMANVDMYDKDPFLWMDPLAMTSMARTIKDWLVKNYPDEASIYEERYSQLEINLTHLQADYQNLRNHSGQILFATLTPSFGNWQRSFNLEVYPLSISKYGVLPNETLLNDIRDRLSSDTVGYIALESGLSPEQLQLYNQIKVEFDLQEIKLKNLFTLTEEDVELNADYFTIMYENLETLESMVR